ncbi:MAG: hypothetical protein NXI12_10010 [Alphaproteobacteria bacterium]|nr:hypothetical protein [Alphaproteobacteria bacterium]
MSGTLFTFIEFCLFFGAILGFGLWQLNEIDRDQKKAEAEDRAEAERDPD